MRSSIFDYIYLKNSKTTLQHYDNKVANQYPLEYIQIFYTI